MKKQIVFIILCLVSVTVHATSDRDEFISRLMSRMTLEEKIGQLNLLPGGDIVTGKVMDSPLAKLISEGKLGAVLSIRDPEKIKALQQVAVKKSRLGIPLLFGFDVIHGFRTVLPIPLAQSCSWDTTAIRLGASMAASEATSQGINWEYSPMVDIALDPRWGRVAEGAGEDPFLGSCIARALVEGIQGNFGPHNAMACLKHYALYGAAEAGRDYNTVDMSHVRMYNQYFPPYEAAVKAGAGSVMSSFNLVDGIPATANDWLINDVLRRQWGFGGFLVTDYGSIGEMTIHGLGDAARCAELALKAGTDMDMCSNVYIAQLKKLVEEGRVSEEDINQACRRVLEAKYTLGLFQNPYRFLDAKRMKTELYTPEHRKLARDMAAETFVLLKNEGDVLPLRKQGTIALIGPLADDRSNMVGCWSTADKPELYSTLKEAMERAVGKEAKVVYSQGCNVYDDSTMQANCSFGRPISRVDATRAEQEALQVATHADVIVCAMGEMTEMSGESSSRADLNLPEAQMRLLRKLCATGKPVVLLNFAGRPTILKWESEHCQAILNVWFAGSEAADAICDVLFGDKGPSGHLTMSLPQCMGQIPIYYNHLNTGRPVAEGAKKYYKYHSNYIDVRNDALYPFGYGLSYTRFSYGKPMLSSPTIAHNGQVKASVVVTNTGKRDGYEVVQLYIHDPSAQIARPVKELKAFRRIHLQAGESRRVDFTLTPDMLKYKDAQGRDVLDAGTYDIMVGSDSSDRNLQKMTLRMVN
ncbi:MAG TPA: beta-glucosidase BglX [Prevotella sp.]|nr:beta-glucosidase BglX [Prevotella sp.]